MTPSAVADMGERLRVHRLHRERANETARETIALLERRLVEALDGEALKGMSSLLPNASFPALRVRQGSGRFGAQEYLPRDGREVLVLRVDGTLAFARRSGEAAELRRPAQDELRADDFEPYVRTVQEAVEAHLARTGRRDAHYARVEEIATRIASVVGASFR